MKRLKTWTSQYHPIVWTVVWGTIFSRVSLFMTMPFLALYLSRTTHTSPLWIGLTIGIGPLTSTFVSFIGGNLSDRFGRQKIVLFSVIAWVIVYIGFSFATALWMFTLLNALNGMCRSFFEPASQALLADVTPKDKRPKVFGLRYWAINIGATLGPLLGAYLGLASSALAFWLTAAVYAAYGFILVSVMHRYQRDLVEKSGTKPSSPVTFRQALRVIQADVALRYFIIAGIIENVGYSQIESNLPQYLKDTQQHGVTIYSVLLATNAVFVVLFQMPISHLASKRTPLQIMTIGSLIFAVGYLGIALSISVIPLVFSMIVLTIGEILVFPTNSILLDQLAPEGMRGSYFGAGGLRNLGHSIGPAAGGWILTTWGGNNLFYIIAVLVALSSILLFRGSQAQKRLTKEAESKDNLVKL
ncbi:MFS transporter [Pullulanibacillus sp. KACC 23026]|uniref:MDR family MFS transporter n=1 Tax=Pullulanibacillus sp. KACC 23026 TaxID=3028315 RepID=UPI0023AEBD38|nr:MFS transporter [Pullulanibacillus sp. KACC 23026]WEG14568.1 MFS transporter [Pullulanibacillus sp. KACC 23026]